MALTKPTMPSPPAACLALLLATAVIAPAAAEDAAMGFLSSGEIDCTFEAMIEPATCSYGLRRGDDGTRRVVITTPGGETRELVFAADGAVTVAGSDTDARVSRAGDSTFVMIFSGDEVFRIPDAVFAAD